MSTQTKAVAVPAVKLATRDELKALRAEIKALKERVSLAIGADQPTEDALLCSVQNACLSAFDDAASAVHVFWRLAPEDTTDKV